MRSLSIDIETYSGINLKDGGVYHYVEASDFQILLFAYAFDNEPIEIVDIAQGEELPAEIAAALTNENITKTAHNANFERTCIAKHFDIELPATQWECTMAKAAMLGLPLALDMVAKVLKLEEGKMSTGKALIRYFSVPCKPTKANDERTRNLPQDAPDKWQEFKDYCVQDVAVEREIKNKISFFNIPKQEKELWALDQRINDTGVLLDPHFINNAIIIDTDYREQLTSEALSLTQLDNPNSVAQLKKWLNEETGILVGSLKKENIENISTHPYTHACDNREAVTRVLEIRQEMAKTSVKKYKAMTNTLCADNRVRGLVQFYGANRTGRWAGRLIQVQNLPRIELKDLDVARQIVSRGDGELLEMLFGNVPDTLSQLIRTAFVASEGYDLTVADFSAIEARVIAWLAGERWRLEVFKTHGKIYEASASQMFKVPLQSITKTSPLRYKGKVSELALGFGGGPNALIKMGALKMGIEEKELPALVAMWRHANKAITRLWDEVENAAINAVETGVSQPLRYGIRFFMEKGILFIELPSKRMLSYIRPTLKTGKFGGFALAYEGMNQTTKQWGIQDTYGGKLVENIVQAIARDCLADAMLRLDNNGYKIVMHVHDETVIETPAGQSSLEDVLKIMAEPIPWAKGLPLAADGFVTKYYKKD